ncbi:MAG: MATE family efflux transporter [Clostridia bacterium]|nr:MATE family efflux transporter [Clostridia bacterium]
MDNQKLYLETKPRRLFFKAAIPGGISMVVASLYMVFDSVFVGKLVGTTAFAALGLAFPLVIINFALSDLIGVGSSVPISIFLGRKENDKANNYFTCASLMIFLTGLVMGLLMYFLAPLFMRLMGAEGELAAYGTQYIRIYAVFSPLTTMTFALDNFLRISGKIKTSMMLNVVMSLGTVVLELLLILGFELGLAGSALGANISFTLAVLFGIAMFAFGRLQLKFVRPVFSGAMIRQIVKNGLPNFLNNVSGRIFSIVMNIMLLGMGGEAAVAVYGIMMTVGSVAEQILYGVLDALQPAVGYNFGAGRMDRVRAIEKYCFSFGATISVAAAILIFTFPKMLALPFLEDISLMPMAEHALRLCSFTYLVKWFGNAVQSMFAALERPFVALCISISSACVFPLLLIAVLLPLALDGLWLNYTVTAYLTAILAFFLMRRHKALLHS